jgi:hypothetical protein
MWWTGLLSCQPTEFMATERLVLFGQMTVKMKRPSGVVLLLT